MEYSVVDEYLFREDGAINFRSYYWHVPNTFFVRECTSSEVILYICVVWNLEQHIHWTCFQSRNTDNRYNDLILNVASKDFTVKTVILNDCKYVWFQHDSVLPHNTQLESNFIDIEFGQREGYSLILSWTTRTHKMTTSITGYNTSKFLLWCVCV